MVRKITKFFIPIFSGILIVLLILMSLVCGGLIAPEHFDSVSIVQWVVYFTFISCSIITNGCAFYSLTKNNKK